MQCSHWISWHPLPSRLYLDLVGENGVKAALWYLMEQLEDLRGSQSTSQTLLYFGAIEPIKFPSVLPSSEPLS